MTAMKFYPLLAILLISTVVGYYCVPEEEHNPMDCYAVTLVVDSNSGEVIKVAGSQEFFSDQLSIDAWMSQNGTVDRDTVNHVVFIEFRQCVEPDRKIK
jgi:hypothetical protein